jgi:hypothetical protein
MAAPDNATFGTHVLKNKKTFYYAGKEQMFTVPAGVTQLTVTARGGEGAGFSAYPSPSSPGFPGRVYAIILVQPGDTLYVFVAGAGTHGGFNGGGACGAGGGYKGNPGGGASDVRMGGATIADRVIVAAGGGAGQAINTYGYGYGGNGGGLAGLGGSGGGSSGSGGGGAGGTQTQGGSGGPGGVSSFRSYLNGQPGSDGASGLGGDGGGGSPYGDSGGGGGGGAGYYGGGGGGGASYYKNCYSRSTQGGGGGGGSSFVESSAIKSRMWTGWRAKGDGRVTFGWN